MKRTDFIPDPEYDIGIDEVIWEYYNGNDWRKLPESDRYSKVFRAASDQLERKTEITFNCPGDLTPVLVGAVEGRYIRARILKMNASTGGTDFVALYISNKKGKSIWSYVFIFNSIILLIFGFMFGWIHAGYSILFQFISTRTIDSFYHRYERVTLQVTTKKAQAVMDKYIKNYRHGISCVEAIGGYSHEKMYLLHTVVSSYEVLDIVELMKTVDSHIIVNVIKTENFFGGFYRPPID